jgi:hypothetical protein
MMGALQSKLAIALTVLSGCLSGLVEGVVRISKNTFAGIASPLAAFFASLFGFTIVFSWQVFDGEPTEMPLHLAHLREILDQLRLSGLTFLFHVIFDDLCISLDQKIAGPWSSHLPETQQ